MDGYNFIFLNQLRAVVQMSDKPAKQNKTFINSFIIAIKSFIITLKHYLFSLFKKNTDNPFVNTIICRTSLDKSIQALSNEIPQIYFTMIPHNWHKITRILQNKLGKELFLVPCIETAILLEQLPQNKPWFGFVHNFPVCLPDWLEKTKPYNGISGSTFFSGNYWSKSKKNCIGLFVFSCEHAFKLRAKVDVPVYFIKCPLPEVGKKWSWKDFEKNNDKKVIQTGWWTQRSHAIYLLPTSVYKKLWLMQSVFRDYECISEEYRHLKSCNILYDFMFETVKEIYDPKQETYETLMTNNIIFAHYYHDNYLNTILECIARQTPILVNPYKAFCEYLGEDYPLYYYYYQDAADKAENIELIFKAHEHLKKIARKNRNGYDNIALTIRQKLGV